MVKFPLFSYNRIRIYKKKEKRFSYIKNFNLILYRDGIRIEGIIIVDEKDNVIGTETSEKCHENDGILHRGILTLIFNNKNQVLLTQRSKFKKLWPEYWDGSCCTHVYPNETYEQAGERRLPQELGFSCKLKFLFKFQFKAKYKNIGSENEVCTVLTGKYNDRVKPNPREVIDWKWVDRDELKNSIDKNPEKYTPWLRIALQQIHIPFL